MIMKTNRKDSEVRVGMPAFYSERKDNVPKQCGTEEISASLTRHAAS